MIVNPIDKGWEIIHQPGHALLAAQIAWHWNEKERPERWLETLAAIAQHDDGGVDWDAQNHLTDVNTPRNFTQAQLKDSLVQATEAIEKTHYQNRWIALLISMHTAYLYGKRQGKQVERFLDEQTKLRTSWLKELEVSEAQAEAAYAIMQFGDQLSLILCQRQVPLDGRSLEIGRGPDGTRYDVKLREDNKLTVTPWGFSEKEFEVYVETYHLPQLTFKDDQELYKILKEVPAVVQKWNFAI
jgi:hypothetical protein